MAVYSRSVRVQAPLEDVWEFHSRIEGLKALTPNWLNLRVEAVTGPDGEENPAVLREGSRAKTSVRPFDIGPRQTWTSVIVHREFDGGSATFRDEMADGPFRHWEHTHSFYADDGATLVHDRVEYDLPLGPLGQAVNPLAVVGLGPMFRYRHRKTRELLDERTADRIPNS